MSPAGTLAPPDVDGPVVAARSPRRLVAGGLVVGLGLAVAGTAGWWVEAGQRLDDVHVVAAPNGVTCTRGEVLVPSGEISFRRGELTPIVLASPGMACSVRLLVVNQGGSGVTLERLVVPGAGPSTGGAVKVVEVSPYGPLTPPRASSGYEAVSEFTDPLSPGDVREVTLQLAFQEDGCSSAGSTARPDGPFLDVRALGRSAAISPVLPPFAYGGTGASECDSAPRD